MKSSDPGGRSHAKKTRTSHTALRLEQLELRSLLSATGLQPDYFVVPAASSGSSGDTPAQIRQAYGFNSVSFGSTAANGSGQTIAIVDAYNDPNITSDLQAFDKALGIANPPSLKIVNQNGGTSLPGTDPAQGWETETALDVEWAHAIAPGANILLVESNSASDTDLFAAVNYARDASGVSVVSMSWGSDDNISNQQQDQSLSQQYLVTPAGHQGVTFVAATGDHGVPGFPATSPNVLAVGGTDLNLNSNNTISSETAWEPQNINGQTWSGGGGPSQEFPGRNTPDVSYNAGVAVQVYDTFGPDHGWIAVGGTSAGAPQWSALVAIADQGRALQGQATLDGASQTLPAIYKVSSADFHDITVGSTQTESAGPGYDLATGRGSPVANLLIPDLSNWTGSSTSGGGGTTQVTAPTAPGNFSGQVISGTQVTLSWSPVSGVTGYQIYTLSGSQPVLVGTVGATTTSTTVSNLTPGSTTSFEVVAYNSAGSAASNWIQVTTPASTTLAAPQNLTVTATSSTVAQVSWNASAGATGYAVYWSNGSRSVELGQVGAGTTSVSVTGLVAGSTDSFSVVAFNATSTASTGWVSVVMPSTAALVAPSVTATATSATTGQLSWTASPGATGYWIYYWNGTQSVLLGNVAAGTTSVTIQSMTAGSTVDFAVVAYNATSYASSTWVALTTPLSSSTTTSTAAGQAADAAFSSYEPNGYRYRS